MHKLLVLMIAVFLAGCVPLGELSAEDIERVIDANSAIETYVAEGTLVTSLRMSSPWLGGESSMTTNVTTYLEENRAQGRAYGYLESSSDLFGGLFDQKTEFYRDQDTVYIHALGTWVEQQGYELQELLTLEDIMRLLEAGVVEVTTEGMQHYRVDVSLDAQQVFSLFLHEEEYEDLFADEDWPTEVAYSISLLVHRRTLYVERIDQFLSITAEREDFHISVITESETVFRDINRPLRIDVPEEVSGQAIRAGDFRLPSLLGAAVAEMN